MSSILKAIIRLNNSLEGLTELGKTVIPTVWLTTVKGYRLKSRETKHKLPVILSQWSYTDSTKFSQSQYVTTHIEYCQPRKFAKL